MCLYIGVLNGLQYIKTSIAQIRIAHKDRVNPDLLMNLKVKLMGSIILKKYIVIRV